MELIRFYALIIQFALLLALVGQLKSCTLTLLGKSAEKSATGMISYSKYTKALTSREEKKKP